MTAAEKLQAAAERRAEWLAKPTRADAPEIDMPEGFWDTATPQMPKTKTPVSLRVDPDILDYFKGQGDGHLTRMHSVLRAYVDAHKLNGMKDKK